MDKKADNFKKLAKTGIIMNFIKKNNGSWTHQLWVDFCKYLEEKGYAPIDFDQVGALLEDKKKTYFAGK